MFVALILLSVDDLFQLHFSVLFLGQVETVNVIVYYIRLIDLWLIYWCFQGPDKMLLLEES